VGVIDISGHSSSFNIENIYLAQMMAMDLENMLLLDQYADMDTVELSWAFGPLAKGLLFFDRDYLVAANQMVCEMFQLSFPVHDICGEDLIDGFKDLYDNPNSQKLVKPQNGVYCYAQLTRKNAHVAQTAPSRRLKVLDPRVSRAQTQGLLAINRNIPLYVSGETGVGKEWMIKSLHRQSNRQSRPLIIVNCCSLSEQLVESELFGHVTGAFTGANPKGAAGYILQADKGILFLDEIADLSLRVQTILLRILQDKVLTPVGSTRSYELDFCLVSASHKDLSEEVRQGRFRKDLYFRLNGIEINIPPLRERLDFSAVLAYLVNKHGKNQLISSELMERLLNYSWPGNIRQLDHFINIICAFAGDDKEITWNHLPNNLKRDLQNPEIRSTSSIQPESSTGDKNYFLESRLNEIALETFKANGCNVSKTSKTLGISRNTLYKRLRQTGIDFKKR
jgi:transcriptional regulator of acetoin/glycerol metabolism